MNRRKLFKSLTAVCVTAMLPMKELLAQCGVDCKQQQPHVYPYPEPSVTVLYECGHTTTIGGTVADPCAIYSEAAGLMRYENGETECPDCLKAIKIHPFDFVELLNDPKLLCTDNWQYGLMRVMHHDANNKLVFDWYRITATEPVRTATGMALFARVIQTQTHNPVGTTLLEAASRDASH